MKATSTWVQMIPAGQFKGRDSRTFWNEDPARVIAATQALDLEAGLLVDFDHSTEARGGPASGWLKEFQVREGAIFGKIEWTERARRAIAEKQYRYVSPVFEHDPDTGEVLRLLRAGLVNNPNLRGTIVICATQSIGSSIPIRIGEVRRMPDKVSVQQEIARHFSPGSHRAIMARGKRPDGTSEPFPGSGDGPAVHPEFAELDTGHSDRGRPEEPERIDPEIRRSGLAPARLDRDGDGDGEESQGNADERDAADASDHQLAGIDHDSEATGEVCAGPGECTVDHIGEAHRLLSRVIARRTTKLHTAAVNPRLTGLVRFASLG